jgi:AcrR family transcriptional regulator
MGASVAGKPGDESDSAAAIVDAEVIWLRPEPSARRSAHTRVEIAQAALEIADAQGFEAVSMRRVAKQLGAGTMTLYNYVRNKDELVALMANAVFAEVLMPPNELPEDWREALRQIAVRSHGALRRHRWALDRLDPGQPAPNDLRRFEQAMRACAKLDISADERFEVVSLVDDYVFGFALREAWEVVEQKQGWRPEVLRFMQHQLEQEEYLVQFRELIGEDLEAGFARASDLFLGEGRFERGLERLLDGIEVDLAKRKRKSGSPARAEHGGL